MSSEKAQEAAVIALLDAAKANPRTLDQLAGVADSSLPAYYCEVYVTERPVEGHRYGGASDKRAWRVQVRAVARSASNAKQVRAYAHAALFDKTVTVGGVESTPMTHPVGDDPIAPDDGWFSGLSEYGYYC